MKAILIRLQIEFPRTHNLSTLRNLIPSDWQITGVHADFDQLSEFAVESRYPANVPDVSPDEAQDAVKDAQRIVRTVQDELDV